MTDYTTLIFHDTDEGCTLNVGNDKYRARGNGYDRKAAAFASFLNDCLGDEVQELKGAAGVDTISNVDSKGRLILVGGGGFDYLKNAVAALGYSVRLVGHVGDNTIFSMVHYTVIEYEKKEIEVAALNLHQTGPEWAVMNKLRRIEA